MKFIVSTRVLIPPSKLQPSNSFCPPGRQKTDNSNMLHMLNNNSITDFRTACKHAVIPSYVIQMLISCLAKTGQDQYLKLNLYLHLYLLYLYIYFGSLFFDKKHCKPPRQISMARTL